MSYYRTVEWKLVPQDLPIVRRNCPKCNEKMHYINSEKFRVNANRSNIDIWLIYQCERCKSTWNMTIYERIKPSDISKDEYQKFLANDKELAMEYGFDRNIHNKNKSELILDRLIYDVFKNDMEQYCEIENERVINIRCKYPTAVRLDKFLSDNLSISRSKIKTMFQNGLIYSNQNKTILKSIVKDGMQIHILS